MHTLRSHVRAHARHMSAPNRSLNTADGIYKQRRASSQRKSERDTATAVCVNHRVACKRNDARLSSMSDGSRARGGSVDGVCVSGATAVPDGNSFGEACIWIQAKEKNIIIIK